MFTSGQKRKSDDLHMRVYISSTLLILFVLFFVPVAYSIETDELNSRNLTAFERLRINLFTNYDKSVQPTYDNQFTNISLGLRVNFIDIDEMDGKVTMHCWLQVRWSDELRSWNVQEYDNIKTIRLGAQDVWRPQIKLINSAGDDSDYLGETEILLSANGSYLWVAPAVYTAYCNLNLRQWPQDKQTCKMQIGSWTLATIVLEDTKMRNVIDYETYVQQSTEWQIIRGNGEYVRKDHYNYVEYTFELQRSSSMYTAIIYTPATCIILLALSAFWLPPQMGEKILLNGILIVIIAAFLMYFAQLLPILAENTPLVVLFYSASLLLLSISTIIEVIVLYLATAKHKRHLPELLKRLLNGKLGTVLLLSYFTAEAEPNTVMHNGTKELEEHVYDNADELSDPLTINPSEAPSTRAIQFNWVLLAIAVDRIAFLGYCVIFSVLAIVYAV